MSIVQSVSGLRATLDELTPELITKYVNAYFKFVCNIHKNQQDKTIVIGRDGRPSGLWIEKTITQKLNQLGCNVEIIGIVPTPTVQLMVEKTTAIGGIAITASHNPSNWNGLKFLNSKGIFLDAEENELFWSFLESKNTIQENNNMQLFVDNNVTINNSIVNDAIAQHIDLLFEIPFIKKEIENIVAKKFNIVVDAVNAAGSKAVVKLVERLGCNCIPLFCDGSGIFPHTPEPLPENLTEISNFIKEKNSNFIGICVDPDADRLVLIDETGNPIGEEKTICIAIDSYFSLNKNAENKFVIVNQSTTMLADIVAEKHRAKIERSAVGEINVVKKMFEVNAVIGGEGSGGVILPECHYGRDSLVGIMLTLAFLAKKNISLKQLSDSYQKLEMVKSKYDFVGNKEDVYNKIIENQATTNENQSSKISLIDGIKITYENSWIHIRTSNTEPIIRIIAEAATKEEAKSLINKTLNCINN